jgi:hypothetical protein
VRKISAVISQETRSGTSTSAGVGVTLSGALGFGVASTDHREQSELSRRLARPERPRPSPVAGCFVWTVVFTVLVAAGAVVALSKGTDKDRRNGVTGLFVCVPVLAAVAGGLWLAKPKAEAEDRRKIELWREAVDLWEGGYYCGRCDGVFRPGDPHVQTPEAALSVS